MSDLNMSGLIQDIGVSFGLPLLFLLLALANIKFSRRKYSGLKLRFSLIFVIGLFAYLICTLMFQDRAVLKAIWQSSPTVYSLAYGLGVILVLFGIGALIYWKLRPAMWQAKNNESTE
jgi:phosphoglycerol transferase MdoB-like AlkP superfamily enzyme